MKALDLEGFREFRMPVQTVSRSRTFIRIRRRIRRVVVAAAALVAPFILHAAAFVPDEATLASAPGAVETVQDSGTTPGVSTAASGALTVPVKVDRIPSDIDLGNGQAWKQLALDVRHDQKHIIEFPFHLAAQGRHWKPALALGAITAGLVALDPHDTPYFRRTTAFHSFDKVGSGANTAAAMLLVPVAFYAWSAHERDTHGKQTVFLAVEAIVDVQILTLGMNMIDRRLRPLDVRPHGNYADTWFDAGVFDRKSFPSGHAITAFAIADVFTERYPQHRWIPWVSYALASAIAFSRLPTQAHFPSDLFAGAVLGPVVTHYLVLHHRDR